MGLVLSEEQRMLRDAARELFDAHAPVSTLRKLRDESDPTGYSPELWHQMVELGWSREAIGRQTSRLPWIKGRSLVFSSRHQALLDAGHRLPVDCAPPWMLPGLLAGALTVGAAVAAASGSDGLGIEFELGTDDFG